MGFIREYKLNDNIVSTSIKLLELESIDVKWLNDADTEYIKLEIQGCKNKLKRYYNKKTENSLRITL